MDMEEEALPPPPLQGPSRPPSSSCERHPDQNFTGFCASCLRERLAGLESLSSTTTTHRNSTSTISSSIKSIFSIRPLPPPNYPSSSSSSSLLQLRRCKSFSAPRISTSFEPQRKSCDVRGRNTLWALFNQHDDAVVAAAAADDDDDDDQGEIREIMPPPVVDDVIIDLPPPRILQEEEEEEDLKPMKDHIDLESSANITRRSFWQAASVFSKKLQKWRRKQKFKKMNKDEPKKPTSSSSSRRRTTYRETQSEMAVDAYGRRSCDTEPRFSLDAGRMSFDDARYSLDEPRASWDGYLIGGGGRSFPRLPPMLSVVEDVPATPVVQRADGHIPVEEDLAVPGGSSQTKDYYSDSSSRSRSRRSLDRSGSVRKSSVEINNLDHKPSKLSPSGHDMFRDWSSNSLRSESFESTYRGGGGEEDPHKRSKPSKRWSKAWSIWGFIHRRRRGPNVVDRSFSESWPEIRAANEYDSGNILPNNTSVSSRSSLHGNAAFGSMRKNGIGKKRREDFVLERNRSGRYSPGHVDNGMLRFYLTPMRSNSRRGGLTKNVHASSYHSFTRSVLRLY